MKKWLCLLLSVILFSSTYAANVENIFYTDDSLSDYSLNADRILASIKKHHQYINILAPQVYRLDANGVVWGSLDPRVKKIAAKYHIKLMPLIINQDFNQKTLHEFLQNTNAQKRAIAAMRTLCKTNKYDGIQFDFENININDKSAYTQFVINAGAAFHQQGLILSVAVVPRVSDFANHSEYAQWNYTNWSGAYDYGKLAQAADFISLMTYDNHTALTTPGPVAAYPWVQAMLTGVLQKVPASKISLGIPLYSGYWYTGTLGSKELVAGFYRFRAREKQISYKEALALLKKFNAKMLWDTSNKTFSAIFSHYGLYEYLYVENVKTFSEKYKLIKKYHLRGFSAWRLGSEDQQIWSFLKKQ